MNPDNHPSSSVISPQGSPLSFTTSHSPRQPLAPRNVYSSTPTTAGNGLGSSVFVPNSFVSKFAPASLPSISRSGFDSGHLGNPSLSTSFHPNYPRAIPSFTSRHDTGLTLPIPPGAGSIVSHTLGSTYNAHIPYSPRLDDANSLISDATHLTSPPSYLLAPAATSYSSATSHSSSELSSAPADTSSPPLTLPANPSRDDFYCFATSGQLQRRPTHKQKWEFKCPSCAEWISSSASSLHEPGSPDAYQQLSGHYGSKNCLKHAKRREKENQKIPLDEDIAMDDVQPIDPAPLMMVVNSCPGVRVDWPVTKGSFYQTFPFHRLGDGYGALSFHLETREHGRVHLAFSKECHGSGLNGHCCSSCRKIPAEIAMLAALAQDAPLQTNFLYLSQQQTTTLLEQRTEEVRGLRLKRLNVSRKLGNALRKIADYKRFMDAVAQQDVPRLQRLVSVGLRRGASVNQIIRTMQMAVDGVYRPRPTICQKTLDMALLVFRLGGRKLLYAVNQGLDIPSLRTLRNHMMFTRVMPTVGWINTDDIRHNIEEVVLKPLFAGPEPPPLRGVSLQIDEVAMEERASHSSRGILGFCWCHSLGLKLSFDTFQDALNLSKLLQDGKAHLGKEMTVVAAYCFGGRQTFPLLALPTCKQTGPVESKLIYETVIDTWNTYAKQRVGPIWSFATDGDASRRKAGYDCFAKNKLSPTSPLFSTLAGMRGMNLFTGIFDITLDSDFKHIFKRFCTLLRSKKGIVLRNGRVVNASILKRFLIRLPGQTDTSVERLIYADDPQDVPRAVELMERIIDIGAMQFESTDPEILADLDSIALLGELIKAILTPFTTPNMSLTEQMSRLSTFAHLSFTLFRNHRMDFMCNQLYVDSHTMVKNAFFCLAKQQLLDPTRPFYLFQTGDDQLEKLFGKLRMLGAHNSAMSYQQAVERLGHACDLQSLYLRNPELEQTPRRLNMSRSEHVDHLNMESWTGDAIAGGCHAPTAWAEGAARASAIFQRLRFDPASYDYQTIFSNPEIDMLRPLGDNKYPGVDNIDEVDASAIPGPASDHAAPPSTTPEMSNAEVLEEGKEGEDAEGLTFAESLPQIPELELPQNRPGFNPQAYLDVGGGKMVHLQRICRLLFNLYQPVKSLDRLKRVCGYQKLHSQRHDLEPDDIHGADAFVIGDLFLTLLRVENEVSLAVVRCTAISNGTSSLGSTLGTTIRDPAAKIKVTGQVLTMELIPTLSNNDTALSQPLPATHAGIRPSNWTETPTSSFSWIWTGAYLVVDSAMAGTTQSTDKVVTVSVPGLLVEPIDPRMVDAIPRLGEEHALKINSEGRSWEIDDGAMGAGCELLWEAVVEHKIAPKDIVGVKTSGGFPYAFSDGKAALVCRPATEQLTRVNEDKTNRKCHLCGAAKVANWRAHIGGHILRFLRGVHESLLQQFENGLPCGFCGRCFAPECQVSLCRTQTAFQATSNCLKSIDFQYGTATKGSSKVPCRNVPVVCRLCHPEDHKRKATLPAQWRYNMPLHLKIAHADYASPLNPGGVHPLPHAVWESMRLEDDEEQDLGIPVEKRSRPFTNVAPAAEALDGTDVVGKKRKVAAGSTAASSSAKPPKRAKKT